MENVYKFLGAERSSFLKDGFLRFTQAAALNDPYECLAAFPQVSSDELIGDLFTSALSTIGLSESDSPEEKSRKHGLINLAFSRLKHMAEHDPWLYKRKAIELNQQRINSQLGILSLSRRWNSALMWSHYTQTYSGFCVGFRREHEFFKEITDEGQPRRTALLPVKYKTERTIIPKRQVDAPGLDIFLTKSEDWAYEQEDRLLALLKDADDIQERKPYPVHLFKVPLDAISEIILGHRAPEGLRIDVLEAGKKLGIAVYKTQLSETTFDVDRSELEDGIHL
ncbi:DUF2971 domain-containing protein [Pseudomonas sp. D3]|uniref:DUF2971 domain-containing protein n=1 Tax=Pseudomonas sp. D3 TaxID=517398 RepID=UPI0023E3A96A|nr:DUF2971 domain-containing protein [Pseudomonas sp. D3]WET08638.1 DUF2971 domain-containing protein [Pseudomonas sp. D3]